MPETIQVVMYGIKNCDTIKKARKWLDANDVQYVFHDYRKDGLTNELLNTLESSLGWEAMINKRGTTWRKLPDNTKKSMDKALAIQTMLDNSAIIKRPILSTGNVFELGFSDTVYQQLFTS